MFFIGKKGATEIDFTMLLEETRSLLVKKFLKWDLPKPSSGSQFEEQVYQTMLDASAGTGFEGSIFRTGTNAFPDIVANKIFGVEVKMTVSDKWVSLGNSVLESTRVKGVETIYVFFGKFGKEFDAKYRKYQECLGDVGVTHSPRYKIDMNLPAGETIFDKLGVDYDSFRKEQHPIKRLKEYYLKQLKEGEGLWWADDVTPGSENSTSSIIRQFKNLDSDSRRRFMAESFILFPSILGNSNLKFERAAVYLVTNYSAVTSSLRDFFSAGGKSRVCFEGKEFFVPQIFETLKDLAPDFKHFFESVSRQKLFEYWGFFVPDNPAVHWKAMAIAAAREGYPEVDLKYLQFFFDDLFNR